jgi:hypothetical protein
MPTVTFAETMNQHHARIGLSARRTKNLRRILALKHQSLDPLAIQAAMGDSNTTRTDIHATSADLAAELHVSLQGTCYQPDTFQVSPEEHAVIATLHKLQGYDSDKRARAADGYLLTIPYEYRAGGDGIAAPVAQEAEAIRTIVEMTIEGLSQTAIAALLNDLNCAAPAGGRWRKDAVREVIRRLPLYAGYVLYRGTEHKKDYWHGELFNGRHQAIIPLSEVNAALTTLGRRFEWVFASGHGPNGQV